MVFASKSEIPGRSTGSAPNPPRMARVRAIFGNPGSDTSHTVKPLSSLVDLTAGAASGVSGPYGGRSLGRGAFCATAEPANHNAERAITRIFIDLTPALFRLRAPACDR